MFGFLQSVKEFMDKTMLTQFLLVWLLNNPKTVEVGAVLTIANSQLVSHQ